MQMLNNLREQLYRYRLEYIKNESSHKTLIKEHNKLIEYIENGDKEKACELIREHITNQEKDIEKIVTVIMSMICVIIVISTVKYHFHKKEEPYEV